MSNRYLLLDGVLYKDALIRLYGREDVLNIEPLYSGTPWQESADLGPILVAPGRYSELLSEAENSAELLASAAVLSSAAPIEDVANHLRKLNKVTDLAGSESLLRYADPLVAFFWLGSYGSSNLRSVMGPINEWRLLEPRHSWLIDSPLKWHVFSSQKQADVLPISRLGQSQMTGIEQAYHWQLKERLYTWLKKNQAADMARIPVDDLKVWLGDRLRGAFDFGLISERSLAVWCVLCLRDGTDFSDAHDGDYRQWLASQNGKSLYSADQRLQQYYQESV